MGHISVPVSCTAPEQEGADGEKELGQFTKNGQVNWMSGFVFVIIIIIIIIIDLTSLLSN
jgi:hypothetical protein